MPVGSGDGILKQKVALLMRPARHRIFWPYGLLLSFILSIVGAVVLSLSHDPSRYFKRNYEWIEVGMTQEEVEAILGPGMQIMREEVPTAVFPKAGVIVPRDLPGRPLATSRNYPTEHRPLVSGEWFLRWQLDSVWIVVGFKDDVVSDKMYWSPSL